MKLIINNIKKDFDKNKVLRGASYCFEKGNIYALLGLNGSGKTTLFNIIYNELQQDEGTIQLYENDKEIALDSIGIMFSEPNLPEFLTGFEFIKFILDIHKIDDFDAYHYLKEIAFNKEDSDKLIKEYSTGMKHKIALLRLLITKPKVILLDEPLTSVDIVTSIELKKRITKLKNDSIIILSTHILELATNISDKIVLLNRGTLREVEKTDSLEQDLIEGMK